jgi:hypothetical protein
MSLGYQPALPARHEGAAIARSGTCEAHRMECGLFCRGGWAHVMVLRSRRHTSCTPGKRSTLMSNHMLSS